MEVTYHGVLSALVASILWSINAPLIKKFGGGINSVAFNALRAATAIPLLFVFVLISGINIEITLAGLLFIFASAIIGPGIGDIAYIASIRRVGAGRAVTIGYTYVFISQILATLLLGEKLSIQLIIGTILALLGVYLVYMEKTGENIPSEAKIIAIIPAIAWGIGSVVNKFALCYADPISLSFIRVLISSSLLAFFVRNEFIKGIRTKRTLLAAFITGGLSYGIGIPLFLYAINVSGVSIIVLVTTLTPVLGRILSMIIADEKVNLIGFAGTLTVVTGIAIGTYSSY